MKLFNTLTMGLLLVSLAGCATSAKFDAKLQTWKGQEASALVQVWGQPDAIEPLHTGDKMYVYARLKHEPTAFNQTPSNLATDSNHRNPASANYVKCSAYFEVDSRSIIVSVMARGEECTSKD